MRPDRIRAYAGDGSVLVTMDLPADGPAVFQTRDAVTFVVFYAGPPESEVVAGRVDFDRRGSFTVDWAEP